MFYFIIICLSSLFKGHNRSHKSQKCSNIISALFPWRYPMKLDTPILGGIATSKCTWSIIMCPSRISTHNHLHDLFIYSCKSLRYWAYITFLRYFGVNTIWYLHIHFVCAKLFAMRNILSVF